MSLAKKGKVAREVGFAMPAPKAWNVKFSQSAPTRGETVYLVAKTRAKSTWVILRPDRNLGVLDRSKRRYVSGITSSREGLFWAPEAVLSEAEKARYEVKARAMVEQGRADRPTMLGHLSGQVALAQVGPLLLAGAPWRALGPGALWTIRMRRRAAGTCILVFMICLMPGGSGSWRSWASGCRSSGAS